MAGVNNRVKSTNDIELKDRLVAINRVTKVTKGGRTFSFAAIVVVGNEDGIVGWGLGKAGEVTTAIAKGVEAAKKNLIKAGTGLYPAEVAPAWYWKVMNRLLSEEPPYWQKLSATVFHPTEITYLFLI